MTGLEAFKIVYNNFDYLISDVCIENDDVNICLKTIKEQLPTIKQALLKAQEQEKEKLFFKNIHNTKVKTPLVSIFEGLSKDERFKFIEHIYYHWEEMKEILEDKNNELEKENAELKAKAQKEHKALEIIKEKNVNIYAFKRDVKQLGKRFTYKYYQCNFGCYHNGFDIELLTEEEFDLLKEVLK